MHDGRHVAVKVQYPGVAESIDSDLGTVSKLLLASRLLPEGLFLEALLKSARYSCPVLWISARASDISWPEWSWAGKSTTSAKHPMHRSSEPCLQKIDRFMFQPW
jgi:hypothetical protein